VSALGHKAVVPSVDGTTPHLIPTPHAPRYTPPIRAPKQDHDEWLGGGGWVGRRSRRSRSSRMGSELAGKSPRVSAVRRRRRRGSATPRPRCVDGRAVAPSAVQDVESRGMAPVGPTPQTRSVYAQNPGRVGEASSHQTRGTTRSEAEPRRRRFTRRDFCRTDPGRAGGQLVRWAMPMSSTFVPCPRAVPAAGPSPSLPTRGRVSGSGCGTASPHGQPSPSPVVGRDGEGEGTGSGRAGGVAGQGPLTRIADAIRPLPPRER
jgi:hypothetical protein